MITRTDPLVEAARRRGGQQRIDSVQRDLEFAHKRRVVLIESAPKLHQDIIDARHALDDALRREASTAVDLATAERDIETLSTMLDQFVLAEERAVEQDHLDLLAARIDAAQADAARAADELAELQATG